MCGRFQLESPIDQLMLRFDAKNRFIGYGLKNEIFPTDHIAIITNDGGQNFIDGAKWGLKNHYNNRPLINARGETVDEKVTFKNMFKQGRCIIPATAFFEWRKNTEESKTKMRIALKDDDIFGMAGLYRFEKDQTGNDMICCTIIITSANQALSDIHDRMPVILPFDQTELWLDHSIKELQIIKGLLAPFEGNVEITVS